MPRAIDPNTRAALDAGATDEFGMVLVDLPSGLWGFHNGYGTLPYNGVNYVGAGSLIEVENLRQSADLSPVPILVRLRAVPDTNLTPDILATIENEQYHQRPCTIMTGYRSTVTGLTLSVEVEYRGLIDQIEQNQNGADASLVLHLESRFRDHLKTGYRVRSYADQQRIDPTDEGLMNVATAHTETFAFGRLTGDAAYYQQLVTTKKANRSFWDKIF